MCPLSYALLFRRVHRQRGLSDHTFFLTDFLTGRGSQKIEYTRADKANVPLKMHTMARSAWPATKPQTRNDPFRKAYIHLTSFTGILQTSLTLETKRRKSQKYRKPLGCLWYGTHHDMVSLQRGIPSTKLG